MSPALRGRRGTFAGAWRSRRGPLSTLLAVSAVVSAGVAATVAYADATGASPGLAFPLVLLGVFALPSAGRELALARRQELALARLRGARGVRLLVFSLAEPLLAVVAGALVGLALAAALARTVVADAVGEPGPVSVAAPGPLLAVGVVVLVALAAVVAGSSAVRREPLADQVALQSRPHAPGAGGAFVTLLVLVGAGVALYRARQGEDPDWMVYAGPALVGLALGQIAVWVVEVTARVLVRRTTAGRLPAFLASRRLARAADAATSLRLLVAAGAVAILATSATGSVDDWLDNSATLATGAPERFDLDATPAEALDLTREADPDGRWAMAEVTVLPASPDERRTFVDTDRYPQVVGDFLDDAGAAGVADLLPTLTEGAATPVPTGDELTVTARTEPADRGFVVAQVSLDYISVSGTTARHDLPLVFRDNDTVTRTVRLRECADGCLPLSLTVNSFVVERDGNHFQQIEDRHPDLHLETFDLGDTDLTSTDWTVTGDDPATAGAIEAEDDGLRLVLPTEGARFYADNDLTAKAPTLALPVLATDGLESRLAEVLTPGSNLRAADVVGTSPVLPMVGPTGVLGDLSAAIVASSPTVPAAQVSVLVRAGAPGAVVERLEEAGGERFTVADAREALIAESGAGRVLVFRLVAIGGLLVALLSLLAGQARERRAFARDAAALRVVGVPTPVLRGAGRRETVLLVVVSVAASCLAGWTAVALLLPHLPLVTAPDLSLPLDLGLQPAAVVGIGLLLAAAVAASAVRARRVDAGATRPEGLIRDGAA